LLTPLDDASIGIIPKAMVLGGGLAGMTAALAIGDQGFDVHLVEREGSLGGNLKRVRLLLEGDPQTIVDDLIRRINEHPQGHVHLGRNVEGISGYVGNFTTKLSGGEQLDHGVVVVATGGTSHESSDYLYGQDPRVVTQLEFEAQLAAADDLPNTAVFIQCVGSRNDENAWCSRVCCGATVKEALRLKDINPDAAVYVLYRDIRTYGLREDAYREAAERGVLFIRYDPDDPPKVVKEAEGLSVQVKDKVLGDSFAILSDRVVLATAIMPQSDNKTFAKMLKIPLSKDGFFLEAHVKLRPLDFATEGVFVCGIAHWPKTVDETAGQAYGGGRPGSHNPFVDEAGDRGHRQQPRPGALSRLRTLRGGLRVRRPRAGRDLHRCVGLPGQRGAVQGLWQVCCHLSHQGDLDASLHR
jgi:heterodisulfide reductase subunit A